MARVGAASAAVVAVAVPAAAADPAARSAGLALRRRDLAGFHELFELAQVFLHLLAWLTSEELCDGETDSPGGGDVVDHDAHFGSATVRTRKEANRARVVHVGVFERPPRDELVLLLVDDLRVPLDGRSGRGFGLPMRTLVVD